MDYSQLSDLEINSLVSAHRWGSVCAVDGTVLHNEKDGEFNPCKNPDDAWSIIAEHKISLIKDSGLYLWVATSDAYWVDGCEWHISQEVMDENPLRAAMIVFLMMQDEKHA